MHDIIRLNTNEYEPDSYKNINLRIMKKGDCWHGRLAGGYKTHSEALDLIGVMNAKIIFC
jgi:hypothetical protein